MLNLRILGNYELIERLGHGGMGEVWRGRHRLLGREAAIKIIRGATGKDETARARFEREAQATSALRSPHTIQLYDYGVAPDGTFYYAMELLDGLDLHSLVEHHGPLEAARVIHVLAQACSSLEEAHHNGLVHRDVKPANLFLCRLGLVYDYVKVLDFGLVTHLPGADAASGRLTDDGTAVGSPAFMAPEVVRGEMDARGDIYALGCVAWWLLTGQVPFEGATPLEVVMAHVERAPDPPSTRTELAVPPALDDLVLRCLQKDPGERPQGVREVAQALAAIGVDPPWGPTRAEAWWRRHRPEVETGVAAAPSRPVAAPERFGPPDLGSPSAPSWEVAAVASDPFGLGWAARVLGPQVTAGLSARQAYSIKLYVGITLLSQVALAVWLTTALATGNFVLGGLIGTSAVLSLLSVFLIALIPRSFPWVVHGVAVWYTVLNIGGNWLSGGVAEAGGTLAWVAIDPVIATLLLGPAHGVPWLVVALLMIPGMPPLLAWLGPPPVPVAPAGLDAMLGSFAGLTLVLGMSVFWFAEQRLIVERQLAAERGRADQLLARLLPPEIVRDLKEGAERARFHEDAGVLVAQLVGLDTLAAKMTATELVGTLDVLYRRFDHLVDHHGLCKIKIGADSYTVASGVPSGSPDHLERLARLAADLRDLMRTDRVRPELDVRVGVAAGSVVAGVVGHTRLLYDLWGDPVRHAYRLAATGPTGSVQVTETVRDRLDEVMPFADGGSVDVEGVSTRVCLLG